ncbi:MAG: response regulator [Candidatus Thermoplasmatota archaeon]
MHRKKILLVEDNPDDIELTKRAFRRCKYSEQIRLEIITDGEKALNYFHSKNNNICSKSYLILLDLNIPKIDGFQVLEKIKNDDTLKLIPVVILTSSGEKKDLKKSYELGANAYIKKPVDFKTFVEIVSKIGEYWIKINQHPYEDTFR